MSFVAATMMVMIVVMRCSTAITEDEAEIGKAILRNCVRAEADAYWFRKSGTAGVYDFGDVRDHILGELAVNGGMQYKGKVVNAENFLRSYAYNHMHDLLNDYFNYEVFEGKDELYQRIFDALSLKTSKNVLKQDTHFAGVKDAIVEESLKLRKRLRNRSIGPHDPV
eukprot:Lankesteria_metandrocarpae@DN413_c0_g1_i1.p1